MVTKKIAIVLAILTLLAFSLRVYRLGAADFKEEEFSTVKAAGYIYYCWQDKNNCQTGSKPSFSSRLVALLQNNETIPNLVLSSYFWDFVADQPTNTHFSRAWPHLLTVAATYRGWGISEFTSRLPSVIWGSLLVPIGFIFARHFGGSVGLSLVYSFLLTIAFPLIDISRHGRMYSMFITIFLLAVYLWHGLLTAKEVRLKMFLTTVLVTLLAYWLQSLTLLLLIGIYVYTAVKNKQWFWWLSFGLLGVIAVRAYWLADFFHSYFLNFTWPAQWQYLKLLFGSIPVAILILYLMLKSRQPYLVTVTLVYLTILVFFTRIPPASAYVLALLPLVLWLMLHWRRWLVIVIMVLVIGQWLGGFNYLYQGRDGRAKIRPAYQQVLNSFTPGDQILGIQVRDYYLQDLPPKTSVIDLQENSDPDFSGSGFVVWEKEKIAHFKPEVVAYVKNNFTHLAGEGLDNWGVEIYSFGK